MDEAERIAHKALCEVVEEMGKHGFISTAHVDYGVKIVGSALRAYADEQVRKFRDRAAKRAWDMQINAFGGGTAIGNDIAALPVNENPLAGA